MKRATGIVGFASVFLITVVMLGTPSAGVAVCLNGTPTVVFDIDGTLTLDELLPWTVRDGAASAAQAYVDLGYKFVVLSARWDGNFSDFATLSVEDVADFLGLCGQVCTQICLPILGCHQECTPDPCAVAGYLDSIIDLSDLSGFLEQYPGLITWLTQKWLEDNGFPDPTRLVQPSALLFSEAEKFAFKSAALDDLAAAGFQVVDAYGDTPSDFEAYAYAGIPPAKVFATRRLSQAQCLGTANVDWDVCIEDGFTDHEANYIDGLLARCKPKSCGLGAELVLVGAALERLRRRHARQAPRARRERLL